MRKLLKSFAVAAQLVQSMEHLQEPVSPSPSTPSSGSPPPDDTFPEHIPSASLLTPQSSQHDKLPSPTLTKRRLASGGTAARDIKARKRDDGASRRAHGHGADGATKDGRDGGGRKEDLLDQDLMEKLKHGTSPVFFLLTYRVFLLNN